MNEFFLFWLKNSFFFLVALSSFTSLYDKEIVSYTTSTNLISVYATFDLLFYKLSPDLIVHHILVIYITLYNYFYKDLYQPEYRDLMIEICLYFEISSIFMVFQTIHDKLVPNKNKNHQILSTILQFVFMGTFYKYRIENFYKEFVLNSDLHTHIYDVCENSANSFLCRNHAYNIYIGFFMLNIYWFTIMIKVLYKKSGLKNILEKINFSFYENILSYTLFFTSLYMIYFYTILNSYQPLYFYDMIGTFILGIASMKYHQFYAYFYKLKEDKYSKELLYNINYYTIIDQLCIKLRCALVIYATYGFSISSLISTILHTIFGSLFVYKSMNNYKSIHNVHLSAGDHMEYQNEKHIDKKIISTYIQQIYQNISLCGGLTFIIDNIIMSTKSNENIYCKYNVLLGILITMGFVVKPFYEINQIYIHILLILQFCVLCGIVVN